ncbi:restriction endonuclease subunit S [Aeromonas salmonicida]|uniref:restriction endonuclease subunit S n=1 Tax=Aeromonas salmonicida TaxID=645 RepID=UPI0038BA3962
MLDTKAKKPEKEAFIAAHTEVKWSRMEASKDGTYAKVKVNNYIIHLQSSCEFSEDSFAYKLINASSLLNEEKELKAAIRKEAAALHLLTKETIEGLSDVQVNELLERKWIVPLHDALHYLPGQQINTLTNKLQALVEKYQITYADNAREIKKVENELVNIIDELDGNEFDLKGLTELKTLLVGNENLKQTMFKKMFPQEGAVTPEIRFKGFSEQWEVKKLEDLGDTYSGLIGKKKEDFGHGSARYVTYMGVFSNILSEGNTTEPIEIDIKQNQVNFGDVLFTTSSETLEEVGMSSVWIGRSENTYLNSFCFGFRPKVTVDPYFFAYNLRSPDFRKSIVFLGQGISRYNISKRRTMSLSISLPTLQEQQKIGTYFLKLDELILLHTIQLEKLKQLKSACLAKMFV